MIKMLQQMNRLSALFRVTSTREFFQIIVRHFFSGTLGKSNPALHRLLVFTTSCVDSHIHLSKHSDELLLLNWKEEGMCMKFYIRKYSRDLLVFTHFFIDKEFTQYVKTIQSDDHEDFKLIVDAGSNIGCSALLLHILFPTTKIVCIEPEASNFSLLNMNIQLNLATSHIVTMQKALWNKVTDLELMQRDWSHDGFHVMQKTVGDEVISKTTTITIPSLMQDMEFDQIDLIKIDIEGAEKIIFEDENHLQKFLPKTRHLIMEVHDEFISEQTITKQLEKFHFKCAPTLMSGQPIAIIAHRKQTT